MNNEIIHLSEELRTAVTAIKQAILQSQYRAAKGVNSEQLSLYFGIGHYISEHSRTGYWGKGAIKSISEQLQRELPGLKGFGERQLKNMRTFYEEWRSYFNSAAIGCRIECRGICGHQFYSPLMVWPFDDFAVTDRQI